MPRKTARIEGERKKIYDINGIKEFMSNKPVLQGILEIILQTEAKKQSISKRLRKKTNETVIIETQNRTKNSSIRKSDGSQHIFFNNNFKFYQPQLSN